MRTKPPAVRKLAPGERCQVRRERKIRRLERRTYRARLRISPADATPIATDGQYTKFNNGQISEYKGTPAEKRCLRVPLGTLIRRIAPRFTLNPARP